MGRTVPTFLVAGAARAGTTSLVEGLRAHPEVFVTTPKEPHYFAMHGSVPDFRGPGDEETINRSAVTDETSYLDLYPRDSGHTALGEGSVSTFYHHEKALPELLRINPRMRVVVLLREPVSRAYSSFQYLRAQGREPEEDFLAAVEQEAARRADGWHHLWHYTAMSRYADSLAAFREQLLPGHLGVWFHDDLERDHGGTLDQVVDFLQLPPLPDGDHEAPRVNISGTPRYQRLQQGLWWASANPAMRRTARTLTTWRFREAVKSRLIRRESVPDDAQRALAPVFEDDLARLRDLLGPTTPLPGWLCSPSGAPTR